MNNALKIIATWYNNQQIKDLTKSCKLKIRGVTMFCLHFLSTHRSDRPENPASIGRHRKVHLDILSFIRHLLFIKWGTCEIDVQELFWASI